MKIRDIGKSDRRWLLLTGLLSLAAALVAFVPAIIKDKGFFLIVDDFNAQQLTFATAVRYALFARPLGDWFWGIDLGTSLTSLPSNFIQGCTALESLVLRYDGVVSLTSALSVYNGISSGTGKVYVPAGMVASYESHARWGQYTIDSIENYVGGENG